MPPPPPEWGAFGRSYIVPPLRVERPDLVYIGDDVVVLEHCWMSVAHAFPDIETALVLGDAVRVGRGCQFSLAGRMVIGPGVLIGDFVHIADTSHDYVAEDRLPALLRPRAVTVEEDAVILGHAVVLPGVRIGAGAVVDHHAVVTSDVAPHSRVAGNPAKQVG
jgi:acetyltransferase-like isoleucine patch superfamily enzyme